MFLLFNNMGGRVNSYGLEMNGPKIDPKNRFFLINKLTPNSYVNSDLIVGLRVRSDQTSGLSLMG